MVNSGLEPSVALGSEFFGLEVEAEFELDCVSVILVVEVVDYWQLLNYFKDLKRKM